MVDQLAITVVDVVTASVGALRERYGVLPFDDDRMIVFAFVERLDFSFHVNDRLHRFLFVVHVGDGRHSFGELPTRAVRNCCFVLVAQRAWYRCLRTYRVRFTFTIFSYFTVEGGARRVTAFYEDFRNRGDVPLLVIFKAGREVVFFYRWLLLLV